MAMPDWITVSELLDTANKLVRQSEQILARDNFTDSWTDELECISHDIETYIGQFNKAWLEG